LIFFSSRPVQLAAARRSANQVPEMQIGCVLAALLKTAGLLPNEP